MQKVWSVRNVKPNLSPALSVKHFIPMSARIITVANPCVTRKSPAHPLCTAVPVRSGPLAPPLLPMGVVLLPGAQSWAGLREWPPPLQRMLGSYQGMRAPVPVCVHFIGVRVHHVSVCVGVSSECACNSACAYSGGLGALLMMRTACALMHSVHVHCVWSHCVCVFGSSACVV